jgi:hypothetical protein
MAIGGYKGGMPVNNEEVMGAIVPVKGQQRRKEISAYGQWYKHWQKN